jgi:hypothetical protein
MHARHALRDSDGIRNLLRHLTKALAHLGAEPTTETRDLADRLRDDLDNQPPHPA